MDNGNPIHLDHDPAGNTVPRICAHADEGGRGAHTLQPGERCPQDPAGHPRGVPPERALEPATLLRTVAEAIRAGGAARVLVTIDALDQGYSPAAVALELRRIIAAYDPRTRHP